MMDIHDAQKFIDFLMTGISSNQGKILISNFGGPSKFVGGTENLLQILTAHESERSNLAVTVAPRNPGFESHSFSQGKIADCAYVTVLKIDFDCEAQKKDAPKQPLSTLQKQEISECLEAAVLPPSAIVDSGGGVHAYWRIKPLQLNSNKSSDSARRVKEVNQTLLDYFAKKVLPGNVDRSVVDVPRLMRLPGSVNYRYENPLPVRILKMLEERVYELADIDAAFKFEPPESTRIHHPTSRSSRQTLLGDEIVEDVWGTLINECAGFKSMHEKQVNEGLDYPFFFAITTFFAQINRQDLAHKFARLHPAYKDSYDSNFQGYGATQKIVDDVLMKFKGEQPFAYMRYQTICGDLNPCGHRVTGDHSSPIRHLLIRLSDSAYRTKRRFKASKAVKIFNARNKVAYVPAHDEFRVFAYPLWVPLSVPHLKRLIDDCFDGNLEPTEIQSVVEKLKVSNQLDTDLHQQLSKRIIFKNGLFDLQSALRENETPSGASLSKHFQYFESMSDCEVADLYLFSSLNAMFDENAAINRFQSYLDSTFKGYEKVIPVVQEMMGYCMQETYPIHCWFLLKGPGGNGKTVLLNLLNHLLKGYAVNMDFSQFGKFSTAELVGKLLCISEELPKTGQNWDLLKTMSGGGMLGAERKYGATFSFRSPTKVICTANETPIMNDGSEGYWTRVILIPFPNSFRNRHEQVLEYETLLYPESDAICLWALRGLLNLLRRKQFNLPPICRDAIANARLENDSVRTFLDERCKLDATASEFTYELYGAYASYCKAHGYRAFSNSRFKERLPPEITQTRQPSDAVPRKSIYIGVRYDDKLGQDERERNDPRSDDYGTPWVRPPETNKVKLLPNPDVAHTESHANLR